MYKYAVLTFAACILQPFSVIALLNVAIIHFVPLAVARNAQVKS